MGSVFRLVLTTSLYASIVGIIIIFVKTIMKNKINPKWHYLIWMVLMIKMLMPFGPESAVSLFNTVPQLPQQTNFTQRYEEHHKAITYVRQEKPDIPTTWVILDSSLHFAAVAEKAVPYVWFTGAVLMLGWLLYTNYSLQRKILKCKTPVPESIKQIFQECKIKMGVSKNIEIIIQDFINTPALFSVLKPKILIPSAIMDMNDRELSYILLHELSHYKRKDLIANHLLLLLQLIHWFNPIIWYCFKRIRQDMEVAADERVLILLESKEQKEYGRALLSVIESFSLSRLAPRLIGMVDDKKNIQKRIKMIKMMDFFKSRKRTVLMIGVICVVLLSGILLTSGLTKNSVEPKQEKISIHASDYDAATLLKFKTPYVGDHVKVGNILNTLPLSSGIKQGFSLKTDKEPYGISVKYKFGAESLSADTIKATFRNNAAVIFALIDNVSEVNFSIISNGEEAKYEYTRAQLQQSYDKDIRDYKKDIASFNTFLDNLSENASVPDDNMVIGEDEKTQSQGPKTIDEAVSIAIKAQGKSYAPGEASTEGHIILDSEEKDGKIIVYTIASYGSFGFENDIFTKVSGSGAIATVITFYKNDKGEYVLKEYKEPMDGSYNLKSKKEMFPKRLWDKVISEHKYYPDLAKQQEEQAKQYLSSIGRNAEVSEKYVEKKSVDINVEASNKLFAEFTKYDPELNKFPFWIGTKELSENGVTYIYETSQTKTSDGYDLVVFRKSKQDGTVVKEYQYKIVGNEPQLINQN